MQQLDYGDSERTSFVGVGLWAWPMPLDWDRDGDLDLIVSCPDVPFRGTYVFENPGGEKLPRFRPPVRVGPPLPNATLSYVEGEPRVLTPGFESVDFRETGFTKKEKIYPRTNIHGQRVRANQWRYVDFDGDRRLDLVVGVGDWTDYGWDNAYDAQGTWTNGPLHGYVYWLRNEGTNDQPEYADPVRVEAAGQPVDVYGMPSPNFADFDGDGDLDLICGEFLDSFQYFENIGSATAPRYRAPERLQHNGQPLVMNLQMIVPSAIDWDDDGDVDLICGDEDGRVALIEHRGVVEEGVPAFLPPQYFRQQAEHLKFGALVTPVGFDWDADGDEDLIAGNSAGHIAFIENLDGGDPPRWAEPQLLQAGGETLRVQAGPHGSIQGPAEAKWGYTTLDVADWDHDGLPDLIVNSIWGKVQWDRNVGTASDPQLAAAQPVRIEWPAGTTPRYPAWNWWKPAPGEFVTQWRTTPVVIDLDEDGDLDLVMLDHEGYLAFFERQADGDRWVLRPGQRIFQDPDGNPLRLNDGVAGRSGRRKLCLADWDGDGRVDLLVNSKSIDWFRNVSSDDQPWTFAPQGAVDPAILAGHTTSPTVVDWNEDGQPDLVIGAEDGHFYYLRNPH